MIKEEESIDLEIARLKRELDGGHFSDKRAKELKKQIKLFEIGKAGEQSLLFELKNSFLPIMILHDIRNEHKGLQAQFDFIVVTRHFFLVIEVKKYYGNITVNEKGEFIRSVYRGRRLISQEGMYSPVRQVERQVEVLRSMLVDHEVIEKTPIRYAVAFANDKTVINLTDAPMDVKDKVFRADGIVSFLKTELTKKSPVHFGDNRMREFAEYIKSQHVTKIEVEEQDETEVSFYLEEAVAEENDNVHEGNGYAPLSDDELETVLKEFRKNLAETSGRKAFHIFTNKMMAELVEKRPITVEELRGINGFGDKKIGDFGRDLISIIRSHQLERR
nr:NERD domain-containing protein [Sporosarcina cyprini]